jgi:hypothetical protein
MDAQTEIDFTPQPNRVEAGPPEISVYSNLLAED